MTLFTTYIITKYSFTYRRVVCILHVSSLLIAKIQRVNMNVHFCMGYAVSKMPSGFFPHGLFLLSLERGTFYIMAGFQDHPIQTKNINHNSLMCNMIHTTFYRSENSDGQPTLKRRGNA